MEYRGIGELYMETILLLEKIDEGFWLDYICYNVQLMNNNVYLPTYFSFLISR